MGCRGSHGPPVVVDREAHGQRRGRGLQRTYRQNFGITVMYASCVIVTGMNAVADWPEPQ
jgi:hypothetical protein